AEVCPLAAGRSRCRDLGDRPAPKDPHLMSNNSNPPSGASQAPSIDSAAPADAAPPAAPPESKRGSPIFRIGILAFSLMLAGTFVGYRAFRGAQPPPLPAPEAAAAPAPVPASQEETVFYGSKSGPIFDSHQTQKARPVMGGSKSMRISGPD